MSPHHAQYRALLGQVNRNAFGQESALTINAGSAFGMRDGHERLEISEVVPLRG